MRIKTRLFMGFLIIGSFIRIIGTISIFQIDNTLNHLILVDKNIKTLNESQNLLLYAVNIKYYDEVLTQSVRNYAFTENDKWKLRYFEIEPILSKELSNASLLGTNIEKEFFIQVGEANEKLIEMELDAIKLVESGDSEKAISILESEKYWNNKEDYQKNLVKYLESRDFEHSTLVMESTKEMEASINASLANTNSWRVTIVLSVIMIIVGALVLGFLISKSIINPIKKLQNTSNQIVKGNLDVKTRINSKDEMGELSKSFDYMIEHLKMNTDIEIQLALQQNLRNALDESSIVSILDPNRMITFVNEKFCKISKYSKEELIGTDQSILRSDKHSLKFYEDLWEKISKGSVWHGEICNKAKDGTLFWNETTIVPFSDKNGKIYEYVAVRTDITHQKALSKKLIEIERLSAIGELSARIAHDIRNPLSVIKNSLGNIKLLKNETGNLDKTIDRCDRAVDRIAHQIDGVMGFLKDSPLESNPISFLEIIHSVIIGMPNHEKIIITMPSKDVTIFGDRIKLESLFYNLIINAVQKLNGEGTITINANEDSDNRIKITISDDGESIPEASLNKIFEALFTTKQQGTGLGLASCKKIIEQHGGSISVSNNPVTFTIILPSKESENN